MMKTVFDAQGLPAELFDPEQFKGAYAQLDTDGSGEVTRAEALAAGMSTTAWKDAMTTLSSAKK